MYPAICSTLFALTLGVFLVDFFAAVFRVAPFTTFLVNLRRNVFFFKFLSFEVAFADVFFVVPLFATPLMGFGEGFRFFAR